MANISLCHTIVNRLTSYDREECCAVAYLALVDAVSRMQSDWSDERRYAYACSYIKGRVMTHFRYNRNKDYEPVTDETARIEADTSGPEVQEFLSSLTAQQREAVRLRMQGHTFEECSTVLGIAPSAVHRLMEGVKDAYSAFHRMSGGLQHPRA